MALSREEKLALLDRYSTPVNHPPRLVYSVPLFFIARLLTGGLRDSDLPEGQYIKMHWFIFFIPLIPLGIFLVSRALNKKGEKTGAYYFHRRVRIKAVTEIWGAGAFLGLVAQSILSYLIPWTLVLVAIGLFLAVAS